MDGDPNAHYEDIGEINADMAECKITLFLQVVAQFFWSLDASFHKQQQQ